MMRKRVYAVRKGHATGLFATWAECQRHTRGYSGAEFKSFTNPQEAQAFLAEATPESKSFGKAGTRTHQQKALAEQEARALLASFPSPSIVCFADGACKGNPGGPCGAGARVEVSGGPKATSTSSLPDAIDHETGQRKTLHITVKRRGDVWGSKTTEASPSPGVSPEPIVLEQYWALGRGTNNIGELRAIEMVLDMVEAHEAETSTSLAGLPMEILTDSSYARGVLVLKWQPKANVELIRTIKAKLEKRRATNPVRIHWVAGHAGIKGNERVDALANQGVEESQVALRHDEQKTRKSASTNAGIIASTQNGGKGSGKKRKRPLH
jgi:ribonuclease HI